MAYAQTEEAHKAVSKTIHLDKETHVDSSERYLWALSFSPFPNAEILKDLLKKFSKINNMPSKTKETLILCIASMARKLPKKHSKVMNCFLFVSKGFGVSNLYLPFQFRPLNSHKG